VSAVLVAHLTRVTLGPTVGTRIFALPFVERSCRPGARSALAVLSVGSRAVP
jgi:hypothetical protein